LDVQYLATTPRGGKFMWHESIRSDPARFQLMRRLPAGVGGILLELAERLALHVQPDAGEELVLVARKAT
jgi:hypothetical protein